MGISSLYYGVITIPLFAIILICAAGIDSTMLNRIISSFFIQYLSKSSYAFFLAQFFTWPITRKSIDLLNGSGNFLTIITSFAVCMFISFILHIVIEKPIQTYFKIK